MKRLLSTLLLVVMLMTMFVPSASAYISHPHVNTNGAALWYQWSQHPFSVLLGEKEEGQEYAVTENIPVSVIKASIEQAEKPFDRANFTEKAFFENNLYKSGIMGLPYSQAETNYSLPVWGVCTDLVKIVLRDYMGYGLGLDGTLWDDDALFQNFADGSEMPDYLAQHTHGTHKLHLIPTLDDTGATRKYYWPYYEDRAAFVEYLKGEERAGRLHVGALMFWTCTANMMFDNGGAGAMINSDGIHHVAMYVGNGYIIESTPTGGFHKGLAYPGSGNGKSGMCKFYLNIDKPDTPKKGTITIEKKSANEAMTNGNKCYSLEGATFEIRNANGELMDTLVMTSSNGYKDKSIELLAGHYTVTETVAGTGYILDSTGLDVEVVAGQNVTKVVKNAPGNDPIGIIINKIDADNNSIPLEGVEFTLKYYDTLNDVSWEDTATRTWVIKTDSDGFSAIRNTYKVSGDEFFTNTNGDVIVPYGTLLIKETKAANDYKIDDEIRTVKISDEYIPKTEEYKTFSITNKHVPMGIISLEKKGLVFTDIETADENGFSVTRPIYSETYLSGAKFDIVAAQDIEVLGEIKYHTGDVVETLTTTANGPVKSSELYYGSYILKESFTPEGYVKAEDTMIDVSSPNNERVITVPASIKNTLQKTDISLEKRAQQIVVADDGSGDVSLVWKPGKGFIFGLFAGQDYKTQDGKKVISKDALVSAVMSDEDGHISFNSYYPVGQYYVRELKAPNARFILDTKKYAVSTSDKGDKVTVIKVQVSDAPIDNVPDMAWAQIVKIDAETNEIVKAAGFKFDIFDSENNKVDFVETDENGIAKLRMPLEHNKSYTVKETKAADGYVLNDSTLTLEINDSTIEKIGENEERYTLRFPDTRVKGKITIEKKGEMITGVEVVEENGFEVKKPVITVEYLSGAKFRITAAEDIVSNGKVIFHKGDKVGEITTSNGRASLDNMYLGKYHIEEVEAPAGYVLVADGKDFELKYAGETIDVVTKDFSFNNDMRPVSAVMEKHIEVMGTITDSEGNVDVTYDYAEGEGIVFGLYNSNDIVNPNTKEVVIEKDSLIGIAVSDKDGIVKFEGKLPVGEYYVKELKTLPKYQPIDDVLYTFDTSVEDETIPHLDFKKDGVIKNDYIPQYVKVNKTDITGGEGLPGATLEIRDEDGDVIYHHVTDSDGALEDVKLIPGTYTLHEIAAPNGYALSEEIVTFTINEDGTIDGETTMKDDVTRFSFYKIDESGKKLSGAEFTMYDENGDVYAIVESDENGVVTFENMLVGDYIIKETKALPDYQLSSQTIELIVTDQWLNSNSYTDGGELMYSITNYEIIPTGVGLSTGAIVAIVAGSIALLVLAGGAVYVFRKKKNA